mgnify:CR=1 FL=1
MARGVNKVILIGNLGNDPDTRYSPQGSAITNLSIATDESYKDKNTGQMVPKTEWHRVVMFGRLAEIAKEYLKKGSKLYIEGRLQTNKWKDKEGQDRYSTDIVANEMQMLDSRGGFDQPQQGGYSAPAQQSQSQGGYSAPAQQPQQQGGYSQQAPQQSAPAPRQAPQQQNAPAPQQQGSYSQQAPQQSAPQQQGGYGQQQAPQQAPQQAAPVDDFDDDIPF